MMKTFCRLTCAALALVGISAPALATTLFGSLSNFDVINDTGEICHGFEIELEGIHPEDISFTFGNPYIRYGDPVKVDTGTSTIVRYASGFDSTTMQWAVGTPFQDPNNPIITGGHQLFFPTYGGDPNYINLPGDHFGVSLNGNPTNTTYRWLLGDAAGNLTTAGSNVRIPAPIWNVTPPANPGGQPAVQAILPALEKENPAAEFGDALWVKVFVTESQDHVELEHLVVGDPQVPDRNDPAEVEVEWELLQAGNVDDLDSGMKELGAGNEAVSRRYEFYEYIGGYDPENHEALVDNAVQHPEAIGNFVGAERRFQFPGNCSRTQHLYSARDLPGESRGETRAAVVNGRRMTLPKRGAPHGAK